jgi:hypothetical protein
VVVPKGNNGIIEISPFPGMTTSYFGVASYPASGTATKIQDGRLLIEGTPRGWMNNCSLVSIGGDAGQVNDWGHTGAGMGFYYDFSYRRAYGGQDNMLLSMISTAQPPLATQKPVATNGFTTLTVKNLAGANQTVYKVTFTTALTSAQIAAIKFPMRVDTNNQFFGYIIPPGCTDVTTGVPIAQVDPSGLWILVDNWTHATDGRALASLPASYGPGVLPSSYGVTPDVPGPLSSYWVTIDAAYQVNCNYMATQITNADLVTTAHITEMPLLNARAAPIQYNDANPLADTPFTTAEMCYASYAASTGVGTWGNGWYCGGGVQRAFVANNGHNDTSYDRKGFYAVDPYYGFYSVQSTGYVLAARPGNGASYTCLIDTAGNAKFSATVIGAQYQIIGNLQTGYSPGTETGLIGWNLSAGQAEVDFINSFTNAVRSFGWYQRGTSTFAELMRLSTSGLVVNTPSISIPSASGSLEIGLGAGTPFIDFHSTAGSNDYDVRVIVSGGTNGSNGLGKLTVTGDLVGTRGITAAANVAAGPNSSFVATLPDSSGFGGYLGTNSSGDVVLGSLKSGNAGVVQVTGALSVQGSGVEVGSVTSTGTSYVDFHSTAGSNDYDVRLAASGGTNGSNGLGTLTVNGNLTTTRGITAAANVAAGPNSSFVCTIPSGSSFGAYLSTNASGDVLLASLASGNTGTLTVSAAGTSVTDLNVAGTGTIAGAWATTSTAISGIGGGTISGTATLRYRKIGRTVFLNVAISGITNTNETVGVRFTVPWTAAALTILAGRENTNTGKALQGVINGTLFQVLYYDNTNPGATGNTLFLSGVLETTT